MIRKVFNWLSGNDSSDHQSPNAKSHLKVGGIFGKMTPEAMCEIDLDKMDIDAIKLQLAKLYKRHNHAAGSLDAALREEARMMLDAIAHCRDKYVDQPLKKKKAQLAKKKQKKK